MKLPAFGIAAEAGRFEHKVAQNRLLRKHGYGRLAVKSKTLLRCERRRYWQEDSDFFCGSQVTIVQLFIFSFQSILIISRYSVLLEKERLERYVRKARFVVKKFDLFQQVAFDLNRFLFFRSASSRRRTLKPCMQ